MYLGENNAGNRELFRAPVTGGPPEVLTSPDQNVETFDVAADTIVYTADPPTKPASSLPGEPINSSASDVTGLTLPELLFPEDWGKLNDTRAGLWVVRGSRKFEVKDPNSHQSLVLSALNDEFKPIIAPDGHTAVVAIPAANVPPAWETYTPAAKEFGFKAKPPTPKNMADFMWPTQYGLLDLEQGTFSPLVDAPIAFLAGYFDFPFAAWSPDGSAILVSGSFLPLPVGKSSPDPLALLPCTAVVVRLPDRHAECVVRPRSAEKDNSHPLSAFDGSFVGSTDEVRIRLRSYKEIRVETYHRQNGVWTLVDTHPKTRVSQGDVSISLRQDLNSPPALWASDQTGHGKKLWDPAPQLSSFGMGQASVYHWKDSSGYDWIGGLIKPVGFKAGRRYPLVIQTHGFHNEGEFITDGAFTTAFAARELAAAGFVVLEVRDRHDHMETADEAADMVRGFETAIAQLNAEGVVDPNRVGIIGFSRTCYYVESALIHDSLRYAAASITDGVRRELSPGSSVQRRSGLTRGTIHLRH